MNLKLILATVCISFLAVGCGMNESQKQTNPPSSIEQSVLVEKVNVKMPNGQNTTVQLFVYPDGKSPMPKAMSKQKRSVATSSSSSLGVKQQRLWYQGNCWASRSGSEWREHGAGDWDYHALFNVKANAPYYVYMSAALYWALKYKGKNLAYGRDWGRDRIWVNLGSNGQYFYYSVWVRTNC